MKTTAAMLMLVIWSSVAVGSSMSVAEKPRSLTGRFVARIAGPPLTTFGMNRESYVFEIDSLPEPQFAILSYTFLLYEPQFPRRVSDYSWLYTFKAVRDERCEQTLEEISKRFIFNAAGEFVEKTSGINYSKNVPPLTLPWKTRLSCYVLSPQSVGSIQ